MGCVSPQYHIIFGNHLHTVFGNASDPNFRQALENGLWDKSRERYPEDEINKEVVLIYSLSPLDEVWLDEKERRTKLLLTLVLGKPGDTCARRTISPPPGPRTRRHQHTSHVSREIHQSACLFLASRVS